MLTNFFFFPWKSSRTHTIKYKVVLKLNSQGFYHLIHKSVKLGSQVGSVPFLLLEGSDTQPWTSRIWKLHFDFHPGIIQVWVSACDFQPRICRHWLVLRELPEASWPAQSQQMCSNFTGSTIPLGGYLVVYQRGKERKLLIPVSLINFVTQIAVCTPHSLPMSQWSAVQSFWGCEDVFIPCSLSHSAQSHPLPWQDDSEVSNTPKVRSFTLAGCDPQSWHHFQPGMNFPWGTLTQAPLGFFNFQPP